MHTIVTNFKKTDHCDYDQILLWHTDIAIIVINGWYVDPCVISSLFGLTLGFSVDGIVGVNLKLHSRPPLGSMIDASSVD